jgi:hypothetical protein
MRRFVTAGFLALFVALFTGCSDQETQSPTEPQFGKEKPADCDLSGTLAGEIRTDIDDLFNDKQKDKAAFEIFNNIERKVCKGQYSDATKMAYDFYVMTYGQLPDKLNGDESDAAALVSKVFAFAADPTGPGAPVIPPEALLPTGGVGIVVPGTPDTIWTNNDEAAFVVDEESFLGDAPVTVVLRRLTDPDPNVPGYPIPGYQAFPEAYDFTASSQLDGFAEFWMCVVTDALPVPFESLVIGHDLGDGESELLAPPLYEEYPGQVIDCTGASYQPVIVGSAGTPGWLQLAGLILEPVVNRILDVKPLNAMYFAGKGLGGRGGSLSPFAPVLGTEFDVSCDVSGGLGTVSLDGGPALCGAGASIDIDSGFPSIGTFVGSESYPAGSEISVAAIPGTGYELTSLDGCDGGVTDPCIVTVAGNRSLTATFALTPGNYDLTPSGGPADGTILVYYTDPYGAPPVTPDQMCVYGPDSLGCSPISVPAGTTVRLVAQPGLGSTFDGWSEACEFATGNECWLAMYEGKAATASFSEDVVVN